MSVSDINYEDVLSSLFIRTFLKDTRMFLEDRGIVTLSNNTFCDDSSLCMMLLLLCVTDQLVHVNICMSFFNTFSSQT